MWFLSNIPHEFILPICYSFGVFHPRPILVPKIHRNWDGEGVGMLGVMVIRYRRYIEHTA